jgi:tripartite ATP-independent transporter DctP family solute receptor
MELFRKSVTRLAVLASFASTVFPWGVSAMAAGATIKIGHAIEKETPLGRSIDRIAEGLTKQGFQAEAKHKIAEWPGTNARGEMAILQALKKDELQMMFLSDGPCSNIAPKCGIFTMPFLFADSEAAYKAADSELILKEISSDFEKQGIHLLAIYENGWRQFFSPKETIKDPAQIKDQKFRVMQSPVYMSFATSMGGNPTPTAWSDVYNQTKAGIVYGFEGPVPAFYSAKLYEVNKHMTLTNHMYSVFYALVNEQTWKKLDGSQKEALRKVVWDERVRQRKENDDDYQDKIGAMKKMKDMKVHKPTAKEIAEFKKATTPVYEEFKAKLSPEVQAYLEGFMKKK